MQGELFARTWGGSRKSAGRKRRALRGSVEHRPRPTFRGARSVHVTMHLVDGLPHLRTTATYRVLVAALGAGSERFGLRLIHWSVLGNHVHLVIEAADRSALSRGMQGLAVRMARALNCVWRRMGRVFSDRSHAHVLGSQTEVRRALGYVLLNARKHAIAGGAVHACSSGEWFDGWIEGAPHVRAAIERPGWLLAARTWLLAQGWRRLVLLDSSSRPGER